MSVRACASALLADGRSFDLVVCNAGVLTSTHSKTADGFEMQFGVNHLGHFLLANRIAPLMRPGARLVSLSSGAHRRADVDLEDLSFERTPYDAFIAHGRSKTANALFAVAFDARHKADGVRAASVHPGFVQTELTRSLGRVSIQRMIGDINARREPAGLPRLAWKSIPQSAATTLWAGLVAGSAQVGGRYCADCRVADPVQKEAYTSELVCAFAINPERAEALWTASEAMVGERF